MNKVFNIINFPAIVILAIISNPYFSYCQASKFKPSFSVVFDSLRGPELITQCTRDTPNNISGYWTPKESDIKILENNFKKIYKYPKNKCNVWPGKIKKLESFAFQYLGVTINKNKLIYINAFPSKEANFFKLNDLDPRTYPRTVCDGGAFFWGTLFDIITKKFVFLAFNARE